MNQVPFREELKRHGYVSIETDDSSFYVSLLEYERAVNSVISSKDEWFEATTLEGYTAHIRCDVITAIIYVPKATAEKFYEHFVESRVRGDT